MIYILNTFGNVDPTLLEAHKDWLLLQMLFLFISYVRIDELYGQKPKYKLYSAEERRFKVAEEGGGRRRRGYNNRPSGMTGGMWADSEGGRGRGWYVQHILL